MRWQLVNSQYYIRGSNYLFAFSYTAAGFFIVSILTKSFDKEGQVNLNWDDDLVKGSCITHNGEVVHDRVK